MDHEMSDASSQIEEKTLESMIIAAVRMQGRYSECGRGFKQIGRRFGRHICGKPFLLHYDDHYKEDDADFEACMPIRTGESEGGISVRELEGGRCIAVRHDGPYETLHRSYATIRAYAEQYDHRIQRPTREIYIKGPGILLKGNPNKYVTEIQFLIQE